MTHKVEQFNNSAYRVRIPVLLLVGKEHYQAKVWWLLESVNFHGVLNGVSVGTAGHHLASACTQTLPTPGLQ